MLVRRVGVLRMPICDLISSLGISCVLLFIVRRMGIGFGCCRTNIRALQVVRLRRKCLRDHVIVHLTIWDCVFCPVSRATER